MQPSSLLTVGGQRQLYTTSFLWLSFAVCIVYTVRDIYIFISVTDYNSICWTIYCAMSASRSNVLCVHCLYAV